MPAPISIAQIHVHSLRLRNGAEALIARVMSADGVAGFGFSLGPEALPARDMAAWDALARGRDVPLYALFGAKRRESVAIERKPDGLPQIDPFELGSIEALRSRVPPNETYSLVAAHAHPWELSFCAALAATLPGELSIAVAEASKATSITVSDAPGIDIDWSLEPGFAELRWI